MVSTISLRSLLLVLFIIFVPFSIYAQTPLKGLESCFAYYDYGKVKVSLSSEKNAYGASEKVQLKGSIINGNSFPLVDGVLYAHIRRKNPETYLTNGHFLIDRVVLLENLNMLPQETKKVEIGLPLKDQYPQGEYEVQYYVFSKHGFHYAGRPFLEEDNAGTTTFTMNSGSKADVYFDVNSVTANGTVQTLRGLTYEYPTGKINFDITIIDTRATKKPLPVLIKFYSFEDSFEDKIISQKRLTVENTGDPLHIEFNPPEQGAYVLVVETNNPIRSVIKYRFAATSDQATDLQMNDVGVSSFPATSTGRAWICFHSPMDEFSPQTTVRLSLLSSSEKVLDQVSITDSFSPDVQAISLPLARLATTDNFWIEAQFTNPADQKRTRSIRIHYDCNRFANSLKNFTVDHDPNNPFVLSIRGTNGCGKAVTKGTINNIRIIQDTIVTKEGMNIPHIPYEFPLDGLQSGTYTAFVRIGDGTKNTAVVIPTGVTPSSLSKNTPRAYKYIAYILFTVVAGACILYALSRKK